MYILYYASVIIFYEIDQIHSSSIIYLNGYIVFYNRADIFIFGSRFLLIVAPSSGDGSISCSIEVSNGRYTGSHG